MFRAGKVVGSMVNLSSTVGSEYFIFVVYFDGSFEVLKTDQSNRVELF